MQLRATEIFKWSIFLSRLLPFYLENVLRYRNAASVALSCICGLAVSIWHGIVCLNTCDRFTIFKMKSKIHGNSAGFS